MINHESGLSSNLKFVKSIYYILNLSTITPKKMIIYSYLLIFNQV